MGTFRLKLILFMQAAIAISMAAHADEKIGSFSIEMLRLRPTLLSQELLGDDFSLADSALAGRWSLNDKVSGYFELGNESNRNLPVYYAAPVEDRVGFVEAYAEYSGVYGILRMGLLPLSFGYDGMKSSNDKIFTDAFPHTERIIGSSDQGVSFQTEQNGYYTQLMIHNGEIDTASDGRLWVSANWGFTDSRRLTAQLSLQTGHVKGAVSTGGTNTIGGVVNGETAAWRNGLFFVNWHPMNWNVVLQTGGGEFRQGTRDGGYTAHMIEVLRYFSKNFGAGLRGDILDPNRKVNGDRKTDISAAFIFKSLDSTSRFVVLATKSMEQDNSVPDDQLRLFWLFTPFAR